MSTKILVVEDNPINSEILGQLLVRCGYDSQLATNGKEAIEFLSQTEFDLILSDIEMPEMDGIELLKAVRENWHEIPMIMVTSFDNQENIQKCWQYGAFDFLSKPVNKKNLMETIHIALSFGHIDISRQNFIDILPKHPRVGKREEIGVVELIDERVLGELKYLLGTERLQKVFRIFYQQSEEAQAFIKDLRPGASVNQTIKEFFHKVKGTAAELGLVRLVQACIYFEGVNALTSEQILFLAETYSKGLDAVQKFESSM